MTGRTDDVLVRREDPAPGVARVVIDRPDKRNGVDAAVRAQLVEVLDRTLADPDVRAVVLAGAGGTFCAGGDLASMDGLTPEEGLTRMREGHRVPRLLAGTDKALVVAVERFAVGIGAG